jgi:hypothetical protein
VFTVRYGLGLYIAFGLFLSNKCLIKVDKQIIHIYLQTYVSVKVELFDPDNKRERINLYRMFAHAAR